MTNPNRKIENNFQRFTKTLYYCKETREMLHINCGKYFIARNL